MTSTPPADSGDSRVAIGPRRIARSITATWWYTVSGVMVFQLVVVLMWMSVHPSRGGTAVTLAMVGIGGLLWCASSVALLQLYRYRDAAAGAAAGWAGTIVPFAVSVVVGVVAGIATGLWTAAVLPSLQPLMLLHWPRGVRMRLVIFVTVVLVALWLVDLHLGGDYNEAVLRNRWVLGGFALALPAMTVISLWWWDVLVTLDRARAAESRLGATQERLRLATDVHDLQGHHLQVISLQLELAERLMGKNPDAAPEQIRLARSSVSEARQGTRDLATRFRGVPLRDEIANAVDLLRAAGVTADASVHADSRQAPTSVLGPVIRETTTNALRHGGGSRAHLSLQRDEAGWRYELSNDSVPDTMPSSDGAGLEGIRRRALDAGGSVEVHRGKHEFSIVVWVPDTAAKGETR